MERLSEMWPGRELSRRTLREYRMALSDLPDAMFERAISACVSGCRFFPSPGEIRARLSPSDLNRLELRRIYGPGGKYHALVANPTEQFERLRARRRARGDSDER